MASTVSFDIDTTNPNIKLGVEVWLDQQLLIDCAHVVKAMPVKVSVDDDDGEHELRVVLKNKRVNDTVVDGEGNIVSDGCLTVRNFKFDDIEVDQLVSEQAVYRHSFNTDLTVTDNRFYWNMGCNGTMSLKFSTPIYIWLLEHL
jgi:hypothetical protein